MTKRLLAIPRTPEPVTVRCLTMEVMSRRGADQNDRRTMERTTNQVWTALSRQQKNGALVAEPEPEIGPQQAWFCQIAK